MVLKPNIKKNNMSKTKKVQKSKKVKEKKSRNLNPYEGLFEGLYLEEDNSLKGFSSTFKYGNV